MSSRTRKECFKKPLLTWQVKFNYIISKPYSERLFLSLGKGREGILYMEKWFFRGMQHYITFELRHDLKKVRKRWLS